MKEAVQKHGSSGKGRIGLFGSLVGWLDEESYVPQVGPVWIVVGIERWCI